MQQSASGMPAAQQNLSDIAVDVANSAVKQKHSGKLAHLEVPLVTNSPSPVSESDSLVTSRIQAIEAAVAYAEQQTQPFACTVADVESCKHLAGQHTMLVALSDGNTATSIVRQYSVAAKSAPLSTSA